jgi:hypothetical protein
MSDLPSIPPIQPQPLSYAAPEKGPSRNKWWMVLLRIFGGILAGGASGLAGWLLAARTDIGWLFFLPPAALLAGLIVIAVKFRRFGYVTGFILAPFVAAAVFAVIVLVIIIIVYNQHHP